MPQLESMIFEEQQIVQPSGTNKVKKDAAPISDEEPESEDGITTSHIVTVMSHTGSSRNESIRALR
jgi:NACalpha-BTF3-like transcription factor